MGLALPRLEPRVQDAVLIDVDGPETPEQSVGTCRGAVVIPADGLPHYATSPGGVRSGLMTMALTSAGSGAAEGTAGTRTR